MEYRITLLTGTGDGGRTKDRTARLARIRGYDGARVLWRRK